VIIVVDYQNEDVEEVLEEGEVSMQEAHFLIDIGVTIP
jgi:hypothetical protein